MARDPVPDFRRSALVALAVTLAAFAVVLVVYAVRKRTEDGAHEGASGSGSAAAGSAAEPRSWIWTSRPDKSWHIPFDPRGVAIADDDHAVVVGDEQVAIVDLTNGEVTAFSPLEIEDDMEHVVRLGSRVVAFGSHDDDPAAWQIQIAPFEMKRLSLPAPRPTKKPTEWPNATVVSPSGNAIFTCATDRVPALRDATSLAITRQFPTVICFDPAFVDETHVAMIGGDDRVIIDLATGKVVVRPGDSVDVRPGPDGRTLKMTEDYIELHDRNGLRHQIEAAPTVNDVYWQSDRVIVFESAGSLHMLPFASAGAPITVSLGSAQPPIAIGPTFGLLVGGRTVARIDLTTGVVQQHNRNLAHIASLVPRGGSVFVDADETREWRDGEIVRTVPDTLRFVVGNATDPVVMVDMDANLFAWTPETDARVPMRELRGVPELGRDGNTVIVSDYETLYRGPIGTALARWRTLKIDAEVAAFDVRNDRFALKTETAIMLVDDRNASVWTVAVPGYDDECEVTADVTFSPDGKTIALAGSDAYVLDAETHRARKIEFGDGFGEEGVTDHAFLPTGEMVAVDNRNVYIYDPVTNATVSWESPIQYDKAAFGISPDGTEIAIGYDDGSIVWADLREVRARARPHHVDVQAVDLCAPDAPGFDGIVAR